MLPRTQSKPRGRLSVDIHPRCGFAIFLGEVSRSFGEKRSLSLERRLVVFSRGLSNLDIRRAVPGVCLSPERAKA